MCDINIQFRNFSIVFVNNLLYSRKRKHVTVNFRWLFIHFFTIHEGSGKQSFRVESQLRPAD